MVILSLNLPSQVTREERVLQLLPTRDCKCELRRLAREMIPGLPARFAVQSKDRPFHPQLPRKKLIIATVISTKTLIRL